MAEWDVEALEASTARVAPQLPQLIDAFYDELFRLDSRLVPFFRTTRMADQKQAIVDLLLLVNDNWRNRDTVLEAARALGWRHRRRYRVPPMTFLVAAYALAVVWSDHDPEWAEREELALLAFLIDLVGAMGEGAGSDLAVTTAEGADSGSSD